jgi:uncharacterized protein (DUF885 family)
MHTIRPRGPFLATGLALLVVSPLSGQAPPATPATLHALARAYYARRDSSYPVGASDQGLHTWDDRLASYSLPAVQARRRHIVNLLARVRAIPAQQWTRDDRIDWLLFRAQLEAVAFFDRVMQNEETNPQVYVGECSNAIFSLLKKEYAPRHVRARAALARLRAMPALLAQGKRNLARPVQLYARLAIDAARSGDDLFNSSLMTLADSLPDTERADLVRAKDSALAALHGFADWLEARLPNLVPWRPMGEANYNYLLKHAICCRSTPRSWPCWARPSWRATAAGGDAERPVARPPDPARRARPARPGRVPRGHRAVSRRWSPSSPRTASSRFRRTSDRS